MAHVGACGGLLPCFIDHSLWLVILCLAMLAFVLLTFLGIYYRIDGDKLMVYSFFIPTAYLIDKIKEIKPTKSVLSAPATSLSHRLAITFGRLDILGDGLYIKSAEWTFWVITE